MANGPVNRESETSFATNFLRDVPPVTRVLVFGTLLLTFGSLAEVLPVSLFVIDWKQIVYKFRIWVPFLTGLHAGTAGFPFLFHLYFLYTYSRQLETNTFFGHTANYAWMLAICQTVIVALAPLMGYFIAGPALLMAIMHVWGRHAGDVTVSLYGIVPIPAKYLSLAFCAINAVLSGKIDFADVAGILAGQLFYFLDTVFPTLPQGRVVISAPAWFERGVNFIEDAGSRALGLVASNTQVSGPRPSGPSTMAPRGNAFGARSAGVTRPTSRGTTHTWGSGRTLGSS